MDPLPIYPVQTFPDRPALILPSIGDAYTPEEVAQAITEEGLLLRQDLDPEVSETPGVEGWYVFVDGGAGFPAESLGARKRQRVKAKAKARAEAKEKKLPRKSASAGPRRRKKGRGAGEPKQFKAKGFNLKKMPLGVATQLLFAAIWPEAYTVSQDYPKPELGPNYPDWFAEMDFNPHIYMNVDDLWPWCREGQADSSWSSMADDCGHSGEPPYQACYLFAQENHGHGPSVERQIAEVFDFPAKLMRSGAPPCSGDCRCAAGGRSVPGRRVRAAAGTGAPPA